MRLLAPMPPQVKIEIDLSSRIEVTVRGAVTTIHEVLPVYIGMSYTDAVRIADEQAELMKLALCRRSPEGA